MLRRYIAGLNPHSGELICAETGEISRKLLQLLEGEKDLCRDRFLLILYSSGCSKRKATSVLSLYRDQGRHIATRRWTERSITNSANSTYIHAASILQKRTGMSSMEKRAIRWLQIRTIL